MDEFQRLEQPDQGLNVGAYAGGYPDIVAALRLFRAPDVIAAVGGLLTVADLQANCFRLEVLAHLAATFCRGRISPTTSAIKSLFDALDDGGCGAREDPSESPFVGLVNTTRGNFRIFEGLREGSSFYLQLILDIVESAPNKEPFDLMKISINSLLQLSDVVAQRAGVLEHEVGQEIPVSDLSSEITAGIPVMSARVSFDRVDLKAIEIQIDDLSPFIFDPGSREKLLDQEIGNSDLERFPLAFWDERLYMALPTAVADAITRFVLDSAKFLQADISFEAAFASRVVALIRDTPLGGRLSGLQLGSAQVEDCLIAHQLVEVDAGRFFHLIVVFESSRMFDSRGLNGVHRFSEAVNSGLSAMIADAHRMANESTQNPEGMTLLVPAGIRRGFRYSLSQDLPREWRLCGMPIHDLVTASWLDDFEPIDLWRIEEAQSKLEELGVMLVNQSGLLNLIGCTRQLNGRIVPENAIPESAPLGVQWIIPLPTNAHRSLRREAQEQHGSRRALNIEGRWVTVRKMGRSLFEEDDSAQIYVATEELTDGELLAVCLAERHAWWIQVKSPEGSSKHLRFEYWGALCSWLSQVAGPIEDAFPKLRIGPFLFIFEFDQIGASQVGVLRARDEEEVREMLSVTATAGGATVTIRVKSGFEDGFVQIENVADRALVEAMIQGAATSTGSDDTSKRQRVLNEVCPRGDARRIHRWPAVSFRDFIWELLYDPPIVPQPMDYANSLLGLGHKLTSFDVPCAVSGKDSCTSVINRVVEILVNEIVSELHYYDRRAFLESIIHNYETAAAHRNRWRYTSRALVATHRDKGGAIRTIIEQNARFNTCTVASRILLEAALCECPLDSNSKPGDLDIARLMAIVMLVHGFGGWSDAIRWGAMAPDIRVTALGEIQANVDFIENVYQPFGRSSGQSSVEQAIENYDSFFENDAYLASTPSELDAEFLAAWEAEFRVSLYGLRKLSLTLEQEALEARCELIEIPRSRLIILLSQEGSISEFEAAEALAFITSSPRGGWFLVPDGFASNDCYPWRFRRRLAILRRPFLQLDNSADPTILCVPGLISDAFRSMIDWYQKGEIPKARSTRMEKWLGRINNVQRTKFNETVAEKLRQLGWNAKADVNVTEILGRSFDRNYGDVDVLAWRTDTGRVLAIECKDLQRQTTIGEVAEQLSDFRGETKPNGKRDHLKRHLDRLDILWANSASVARFLKLKAPLPIEGHLVFSRNVPMRFAWDQIASRVKLSLFTRLESI